MNAAGDQPQPQTPRRGYLLPSARTDWRTPRELVQRIKDFWGGDIDLDPCADVQAKHHFAVVNLFPPRSDGLRANWRNRSTTVYCNPPYGRGIGRWIAKAAMEYEAATELQILMLIPAAVDTRHWQERVFPTATAVCFLRGRLRFEGAPASAPMANALVYWGRNLHDFARYFGPIGRVLPVHDLRKDNATPLPPPVNEAPPQELIHPDDLPGAAVTLE